MDVKETGLGHMVFPGQTFQMDFYLSAPADDVKKNLLETGGKFIMPSISGCVTYHSAFGNELYYVRQSYMLRLAVPFGTLDILPPGTEIKREGLALRPDFLAPGEAN